MKERTATEKLNIALQGIDSVLAVMKAGPSPMDEKLIDKARAYCEEAQDALLTIQFHLSQLR